MKYAALTLCLVASPAFADAAIYQGTIGDKPVVVEFSDMPAAGNMALFGRYAYLSQGADIPLHAIKAARSRLGGALNGLGGVAFLNDDRGCLCGRSHVLDEPPPRDRERIRRTAP